MRRFIFTAPFLLILAGLAVWTVGEGVDMLQDAYGGREASAQETLGGERSLTGGDRSAAVWGFLVLAVGIVLAAGVLALAWWSFRDAPEVSVE